MDSILFKVIGNSNAFYMIQYQIINSNQQSDDKNTIESGVNYITTKSVDQTKNFKKYLNLTNFKVEFEQPYLVTFYSPNCKFDAYWESKVNLEPQKLSVSYLDNYAYYIIGSDNPYYDQEQYKFYYEIQEADISEFPKKFCAVNVAGLELSNSNTEWNGRSISLSEGVPHTYIFSNNYPLIYYSYHASNTQNTLVLNFNLIDKASFNVTIRVNRNFLSSKTIYRNTQLYVKKEDFKVCPKDEVCTVDVEVEMWNSTRDRRVELTMYQLDGLPFYLEKNILKDDILHGNNPRHYYFDIGSDEYGDITLDFKRGSGFIYASLVPRIDPVKAENPEWRGVYEFPMSEVGTLTYRIYDKKIMIYPTNTKDCANSGGCYVLITILGNLVSPKNEEIPYRISIIPRIMKVDNTVDSPKVKINVNEFIIGDILLGQAENRKYDFYTLVLPYDSDYILIDWQADNPSLVINVGPDRPTRETKHFGFPAIDHDTVYRLNRSEILTHVSISDDDTSNKTLRNVELTIGIYSDTSDSLQSSPYAFKLFMPPILGETEKGEIISAEIIHIRSDQKVQCIPFEFDTGIYICLFAVIFDDSDVMSSLVAYPRSQEGYPIEIYGDFVKAENIEKNDRWTIYSSVISVFNADNKKEQKYIYVDNINKDESYLIIVKTDDPETVIEVLSSTYNIGNKMTFYPNPSTPQILAIRNNSIDIQILTSQDLLINIGSVSGLGAIYWSDDENNKYYLNELGDKLSLTNHKDNPAQIYTPLMIDPLVQLEFKEGGFIFYITYYPRSYIDQVKRDSTTEFQYRTVRMPLNFYVPVKYYLPNTINFNIYNMNTTDGKDFVYDSDYFDVWGTLISNTEAVTIRIDDHYRPNINEVNYTKGVFDIVFATLYFSEDEMNKFQPKEGEGKIPNIFFTLESKTNENIFSSFGLELDISSIEKEFGAEPTPEGIYLTGNLNNTVLGKKAYQLKLDPNRHYLRIEYSSNSYFINYALTSDIESEETDDLNITITDGYGKKIITVIFEDDYFEKNSNYLYFIVFTNYRNADPKLQYYVLKYLTSENLQNLADTLIPVSSRLDVTKLNTDNTKFEIKFNPVLYEIGVTYYIKAIYKDQVNFEENINTIAISEAKGLNIQIGKPEIIDGMIKYTLNSNQEVSYIKVLARFNFLYGKNVYLYTPYETDITEIQYENNASVPITNANKKQRYELVFRTGTLDNVKNYIKVIVHNDKGIQPPVLYFSPTDSKCIQNRVQLAKGGEMWIKKEQFHNENFYFLVECIKENECDYTLTFSDHDTVEFGSARIFSYYVSFYNQNMVFKFKNDRNSNEDHITLYATGGKNTNITFDECADIDKCQASKFSDGVAITTTTKGSEYFTLNVAAEYGDYITVGVKIIDSNGKSSENTLSSEAGQISGFLRKGLLEKECYLLPEAKDIYYITGTLYNAYAIIGLANSENMEIDESNITFVKKGFFSYVHDNSINQKTGIYLCVAMVKLDLYEVDSLSYSIQLQSKSNFIGNNYPPHYPGAIYPGIIPTGKLAYFNFIFPHVPSDYSVFNMITTEGYPKMFVYECFSYPFCELEYNNLEKNTDVKRISDINRMSTYFVETKFMGSPIDAQQHILVVKCNDVPNGEKEGYNHCAFMTSSYGEKEEVELIERQPFGQYMIQNDTDQYLIDISKETKDKLKIHIDFYVVSGDVSFEFRDGNDANITDIHKYYLANKIFYSLTIDKNKKRNVGLKYIKIKATAKINSYYIAEYKVLKDEFEEKANAIYSNINYLISISQNSTGEQNKTLLIKGIKIVRPRAFIDTFYSLNCKINIHKVVGTGDSEQLSSFGDFAQEFHELGEGENMNYERPYIITIDQNEKYVLNDKDMCMIYVSGFEIYNTDSGVRKEILLSEGVPHLVHFDPDLKIMRYVYPHADPRKNLTVSINMIIPGKFKVHYFFREQEFNTDLEVSQSTILYVPNYAIQTGCQEEDELCSVTVQLENTEQYDGADPIIETTIKQIKNSPYYVPRGIIRKDYISGDAFLFIYTDVGQDEGYITINFDRESGFVFGKVVEIYQTKVDTDADWRNYKFIRNKNEDGSLKYDFYNKKLLFSKAETQKCGDGCYILISIKTSVYKDNIQDSEYQFFTLLADFTPKNYEDKHKYQKLIILDPEEYIIGSLYKNDDVNNKGLFEYYTLKIPYNITAVEIDWQSDTAELLVNTRTEKPNNERHDFKFKKRRDTNIRISREDILKKINGDDFVYDGRSLQGSDITFGVYTKNYDSMGSTVYAFRVHLPKPKLNIYKVTSDQKAICKPEKLNENEYRCLFMIIYYNFQVFNDLIVYAESQSPSAIVNMYANYIDNNIYNSYNVDQLIAKIPTESDAIYNTKRDLTKFIFLSYANSESNAYISVISDKPDDIELYSSFKTFEDSLSPNPSTAQVYSMGLEKQNITLDFITTKSIAVNIRSLYGEAKIYLKKDEGNSYYLRGVEDTLDLIIKANDGESVLMVENLRYQPGQHGNPGFAFVLEFYSRNPGIELDMLKIDETLEIAYQDAAFPVYYYSKIFDTDKDINAFFYLHNVIDSERTIVSNELIIKAKVMEETKIDEIKEDPSKLPSSNEFTESGFYDSTLQAGSILVTKDKFDKFTQLTLPTLLIAIEKKDNNVKYNRIRGEFGLSTINGDAPVTQKLYQFGTIKDYNTLINYKLETDITTTNYMRIQFSSNSKYVNFAINAKKDQRENGTFTGFTAKKDRGITFVTFEKPKNVDYLYLSVFLGQNSDNQKLNNYVFKYMNALKIEGFTEYTMKDNNPNIEIQKDNNNLNVKFSQIDYKSDDKTDISILYTVKIVTNQDSVTDENANVIAITQSNINDKIVKHDESSNQKQVTLTNVPNDIKYVQVIATITQGSIIEYVAYQAVNSTGGAIIDPNPVEVIMPPNPTDTPSTDPKTTDGTTSKDNAGLYVIIGVSAFLLVVVVVLIIVIVRYNSKNKDLLSQVNKISFVQSGATENKDDANLLLDNQNELD